jgi:ABC-type enterochelin transport system substrate-binding protein
MKKFLKFIFSMTALFLLLAACQSNDDLTEKAPTQQLSHSDNGVSIRTEQTEYYTSVDKIAVIIQNESTLDFVTGAHVFLDKKVGNTWYKVPMKSNSFTEEGVIHPTGETTSLTLHVQDLNHHLTAGEYRALIGGLAAPFRVINNE